jgi:hypothetical protein
VKAPLYPLEYQMHLFRLLAERAGLADVKLAFKIEGADHS